MNDPEQRDHADVIESAFGEILEPGEVVLCPDCGLHGFVTEGVWRDA